LDPIRTFVPAAINSTGIQADRKTAVNNHLVTTAG
jgi:hypothetical protein